jgi:hypothetical protein
VEMARKARGSARSQSRQKLWPLGKGMPELLR